MVRRNEANFKLVRLHPPADGLCDGAQTRDQISEDFRNNGLFAIALRQLGRIVDLDHDRVGARGDGGQRHLRHEIAQADAVGGIDHDGEMRFGFQQRHG